MTGSIIDQTYSVATLKRPASYTWKPAADITAYELALALPIFHASSLGGWAYEVERMVEGLPPEVQRHFEKND